MELNKQQSDVVKYIDGPLVVLAGAGSGKTATMTEKIAHLINDVGIMPSRIWGCTLTNKAANEIKSRVKKKVGIKAENVKLSTIHSMAYRILKQGLLTKDPYHRMPKIITNDSIKIYTILSLIWKHRFPYGRRDPKEYLEEINELQVNKLLTPKKYAALIGIDTSIPIADDFNKLNISRSEEFTYHAYNHYEKWKKKTRQMDFNDILVGCYNLMHDDRYAKFVSGLSQRCEYGIIDEGQDTNTLCFKIFKKLINHYKNATVVGDLKQCIFKFQGANIKNITGFIDEYNAKVMDLPTNYRSTKTIVENSNYFMKDIDYNIGTPSDTPNEIGESIKYFTSEDNHQEAEKIHQTISDLKSQGAEYKDITILYRVHSQSFEIEATLMRENIPYVTYNQSILTDRSEIKPIIQYLNLFMNPGKCSLKRFEALVKKPGRFVSNNLIDDFKELVNEYDEEKNCVGAIKLIESGELQLPNGYNCEGLSSFADDIMEGHKKYNEGVRPCDLIAYILDTIGYAKWADEIYNKKKDTQNDMLMNFDTLRSVAETTNTLEEFFDLLKEMKKRSKGEGKYKDSVKLMTVHACVTGDTLVNVGNKTMKIENAPRTGIVETKDGNFAYRDKFTYPQSEIIKMTTKHGFHLNMTPEHGINIWDGTKFIKTNAENIRKGDIVRIKKSTTKKITTNVKIKATHIKSDIRAKIFKLPTHIDENLGEFFGLMVADGILYKGGFRVIKRYKSTLMRLKYLCRELFGIDSPIKKINRGKSDHYLIEFNSVCIREWLNNFPFILPNSKYVPHEILNSPRSVQKAFISGFAEDGSVVKKQNKLDHIRLNSSVGENIGRIQFMLREMGIFATKKKYPTKNIKYKDMYALYISGTDASKYAEQINGMAKERDVILKTAERPVKNRRIIPLSNAEYKIIGRQNFGKISTAQNARLRGHISEAKANWILKTQNLSESARIMLNEKLSWFYSPVETLESSYEKTYCFEVPHGDAFLQNGIDAFNSKGKEFDNVIIAGVCSRIFPFYRALEEVGGKEEEKRIMYVAITRPAKRLYFSVISHMYGRYKVMPSYFIKQMNFKYITGGTNV